MNDRRAIKTVDGANNAIPTWTRRMNLEVHPTVQEID
jgi:hypothetical protein